MKDKSVEKCNWKISNYPPSVNLHACSMQARSPVLAIEKGSECWDREDR